MHKWIKHILFPTFIPGTARRCALVALRHVSQMTQTNDEINSRVEPIFPRAQDRIQLQYSDLLSSPCRSVFDARTFCWAEQVVT